MLSEGEGWSVAEMYTVTKITKYALRKQELDITSTFIGYIFLIIQY